MVPDALVYTYERVTYPQPVPAADAFSYTYEHIATVSPSLSPWPDALAYTYERIRYSALNPTSDGIAYTYENIASSASPNPTKLKVWDGTQWVAQPYYVWNGTAWVQIT